MIKSVSMDRSAIQVQFNVFNTVLHVFQDCIAMRQLQHCIRVVCPLELHGYSQRTRSNAVAGAVVSWICCDVAN